MSACLDSWAVLAWLGDEAPAADRIDEAIAASPEILGQPDLPCAVEDLRPQPA